MKQVPQKEMDVLLRKWSQSEASEKSDAAEMQSAHLDADELSAYAENALPPAAKAKYTEHLADCSACRRIVANLAPITVAVEPKKETTPSVVREFFSRLMAPSFLRYAVPSLAAVVILAVGFIWMNRQSGDTNRELRTMVAQNEAPSSAPAETATQNNDPKIARGNVHTDRSATKPQSAAEPQSQSTPATVEADEKRKQEEAQKRAENGRADAVRQAAAAPPPPAAPPKDAPSVAGNRDFEKSAEVAEKKPSANEPKAIKEETRIDDLKAMAGVKTQPAPVARRARTPTASATVADSAGRAGQESENGRDKGSSKNKEASETRQVAGRSFRKVDGGWTDTAYRSEATTNLSRGSEQFRALVADEPSIRTIAEQLDGTVIVVWKSRAYRIR